MEWMLLFLLYSQTLKLSPLADRLTSDQAAVKWTKKISKKAKS
jgi:hypothetical protein